MLSLVIENEFQESCNIKITVLSEKLDCCALCTTET